MVRCTYGEVVWQSNQLLAQGQVFEDEIRSGAIMAGILPKTANRVCRQIFDSATTPCFKETTTLAKRNVPVEEIPAVAVAVAECEAKHVQCRLAVVDSNGCERDWHTIIESYPRDRHCMSNFVEGK